MKAEQAIEGRLYHLREKGIYKEEKAAECYGPNYSKEFMRFLVFDKYGVRKIRMAMLNEEVEAL